MYTGGDRQVWCGIGKGGGQVCRLGDGGGGGKGEDHVWAA